MIIHDIQKILEQNEFEDIEISKVSALSDAEKIGCSFVAENNEVEFQCFVGFVSDIKYQNKLVFKVFNVHDDTPCYIFVGAKNTKCFLDKNSQLIEEKFVWWFEIEFIFAIRKIAKAYNKRHPDYENIGFMRRFFIVELPHLIMLGIALYAGIFEFIKHREISDKVSIVLAVAIIISFIFVLATIPFKNKIRRAKNLEWELEKPWTWFISYAGRLFWAVLCFYPLYFSLIILKKTLLTVGKILLWILGVIFDSSSDSSTSSSRSSSSSGGRSSRKNSSSSHSGNSYNSSSSTITTEKSTYWWVCWYCRTKVQHDKWVSPKNSSWMCPCSLEPSKTHKWENCGQVGNITWQCSKCGLVLDLKTGPRSTSRSCGGKGSHNWHRL